MAPMLRTISLAAAAAALLLFASPQTRGWETEDDQAADMVPASTPAERVLVATPGPGGGAGTMAAPVCLQCRCCYKSSPGSCQLTTCCSTFNCNAGKCNLVQQKCGCSGCGGGN